MIRVLVVDDSATMRGLIKATLERAPDLQVVGVAADAYEAREAIKALDPDVVTLDVEMPNMNGLDFLERLMRLRPTPVVMVSSLTPRGGEAAVRALELGAVDCVAKPTPEDPHAFDALAEAVRTAVGARPRRTNAAPTAGPPERFRPDGRIVAIGASTGGVEALITLLSSFPENCPPTVIVQHMPGAFTRSFASRLNRLTAPEVKEAVDGAPLRVGEVHLAAGGANHLQIMGSGRLCRVQAGEPVNGHRPSVDVLFASVARSLGPRALGVILTGMGRDGAQGLRQMREAGARTLGQDEASCVVYGMPKAAAEIGAVERQLPLGRLGPEIIRLAQADSLVSG